jgi:tRNA (guanine37-N1)-methyltransferase
MSFHFDVISLFPEMLESYLASSILGRALENGLIDVELTNPRDFTTDRHHKVDDTPFGGGAGMLMMAEPIYQAVADVRTRRSPHKVLLLSPSGRVFDQDIAMEIASWGSVALVCGRYEGIDDRVSEHVVDGELSVGDYVLTGGEIAALAVIDAVSRLLDGVLGNSEGAANESFADAHLLEQPQFTRPRVWRDHKIPEILLSGDHAKIHSWRLEKRIARTRDRRPDLYAKFLERQE